MSDDEADPELLELLRRQLFGDVIPHNDAETGVLRDAEHVYDNAIDVAIDMRATKDVAASLYAQMRQKSWSAAVWAANDLHPKARDENTVAFIFTVSTLNFSFWSDRPEDEAFAVWYRDKRWTGYWSLVACLQRACDEGIPITSSDFWQSQDEFNMDTMRHVFRSCTVEEMPLLAERLDCLREVGQVLYEKYNCSFVDLVSAAGGSAARLVNIIARDFACFRDECIFEGRSKPVRILKRAQILVADLWACFEGDGYGKFADIDQLTMFADYRVPQWLNTFGCLLYSPPLTARISKNKLIESGSRWEIELRACSIWCVELIRREIVRNNPDAQINAVLIDYYMWEHMKELQRTNQEPVPHHRSRSIWY